MNLPDLVLVDGAEGAVFDPRDRGLMYGDGVFRTVRVVDGAARWWDEQLDKLARDAARLGIPGVPAGIWAADLARFAGRMDQGVLKLILTRGSGPRGYRPPPGSQPRRLLMYSPGPLPEMPPGGVVARVCSLRLAQQPALAGIKHLNRLENVLARGEWDDPGIHEGILLDQNGGLVSGVMSNLFLWRGGRLETPVLDRCGVAGLARARLMRLAAAEGLRVAERALGLDDLYAAEEVMFTNSLIGLWRLGRLEHRTWPAPAISPRLRALLDA